jgi:hypothetical protein
MHCSEINVLNFEGTQNQKNLRILLSNIAEICVKGIVRPFGGGRE